MKTLVNGLLGLFGYGIHKAGAVERLTAERLGPLHAERAELARRCMELQDYAASLERSSQDLAQRNEVLEARIRSLSTDLEAERVKAEFAMQRLQRVREQEAAA